MSIELSFEKVKVNALKAYAEGRLSAQNGTPQARYRDASGHPCAIGASLSDEEAELCDGLDPETNEPLNLSVSSLAYRGILVFPIRKDMEKTRQLQYLHDVWAGSAQANAPGAVKLYKKQFLDYLQPERKEQADDKSNPKPDLLAQQDQVPPEREVQAPDQEAVA